MPLTHSFKPILSGREDQENREQLLRRVFETKYAWLLRWALHFTENDRTAAEDLVQETFVRLLISWDTLTDLHDVEPLLYSYLRYAHLTERRRGRSHAFQSLSTADFDTLAMSLRSFSSADQIQTQNEIREILAFLLWRRRTARFASMFLLRFFHGYFPEEIASICIMKRVGVDMGLRQARLELKAYLSDPKQIQVLGHPAYTRKKSPNHAIALEAFEEELRKEMAHPANELCPPTEELERRYQSLNMRALENDLLAHVVTCESCLRKAARQRDVPPPSSRSMEDSFSRAPRGRSKKSNPSNERLISKLIADGKGRMREIYEHRPTGIAIALNAEVVAVRDISSGLATLKIETRAVESLDIIEIFSEQGLLLLALPLRERPPRTEPELRHEAALSGGRRLILQVRFAGDKALIETTYEDPCFDSLPAGALYLEIDENQTFPVNPGADDAQTGPPINQAPSLPRQLWHSLRQYLFELRPRALFTPLAFAALIVLISLIWRNTNGQMQREEANQMLRAAVREQARVQSTEQPRVVHQRVQIQGAGHRVQRDLYRDVHARRTPKKESVEPDEAVLRIKLANAGIDWQDPLSAQGYRDWHDELYRQHDQVTALPSDLLMLTTIADQGRVLKETITLRKVDFHTISRAVTFRDGDTVEISELVYEVLPWNSQVEQQFEPLPADSSKTLKPLPGRIPTAPSAVDDTQINIAELNTLLALQELHADTERLSVRRTEYGILVEGVVDSDERKAEIAARLRALANVTSKISSYRDLETTSLPTDRVLSVKALSASTGDTVLKRICEDRTIDRDRCRQLSYALLNSSATLVRESECLRQLAQQYPADKPLALETRSLLVDLTSKHLEQLNAAIGSQQQTMELLDVPTQPAIGKSGLSSDTPTVIARRNLALSKELVYAEDAHSRSPTVVLQELAASGSELRIAVSAATATTHPLLYPVNPTK